jgi:hypothetical protein
MRVRGDIQPEQFHNSGALRQPKLGENRKQRQQKLIRINENAHELPADLGEVSGLASSHHLAARQITGISSALSAIPNAEGRASARPIRRRCCDSILRRAEFVFNVKHAVSSTVWNTLQDFVSVSRVWCANGATH